MNAVNAMSVARRHRCTALYLVLAALGLLWQFVPLNDAQARLMSLSCNGVDYTVQTVPETDAEKAVYGQAEVTKRAVILRGQNPFLITVIDGTRNRHAVHDPAYCFRGAGWEVAAKRTLALDSGNACWLRLTKESQNQEIVFWFSDGAVRYDSPLRCWLQTAVRRATLGLSGAEPVLVILEPLSSSAPDWSIILSTFEPFEEI